jgi:ActR/RegA family two-component response regulator
MTGHVLIIVDDDQSMAETLTEAMTRRGFVVTCRARGAI